MNERSWILAKTIKKLTQNCAVLLKKSVKTILSESNRSQSEAVAQASQASHF